MHLPPKTSNLCNITLAAKVYTLQHQVRPQNPVNWFCCWWCRACSSVAVGLRLSVPMKLLLQEKCMPLSAMSISDFSYNNEIRRQVILSWKNEGIHGIQSFRHGWEQPQCTTRESSFFIKSESYSRGREAQRLLRALRRL